MSLFWETYWAFCVAYFVWCWSREHKRRLELEEQLHAALMELAIRRHPTHKHRYPYWLDNETKEN